jgi:hypothetical protein
MGDVTEVIVTRLVRLPREEPASEFKCLLRFDTCTLVDCRASGDRVE